MPFGDKWLLIPLAHVRMHNLCLWRDQRCFTTHPCTFHQCWSSCKNQNLNETRLILILVATVQAVLARHGRQDRRAVLRERCALEICIASKFCEFTSKPVHLQSFKASKREHRTHFLVVLVCRTVLVKVKWKSFFHQKHQKWNYFEDS